MQFYWFPIFDGIMTFQSALVLVMILAGALTLIASIVHTRLIFKVVVNPLYRRRWQILRGMMYFFLIGYVGAILIVLSEPDSLLSILAGAVFFAGAGFVYIVVRLGEATITELSFRRKESEEKAQAFEKLNLALIEKNRELEQFAYVASHDLQEPLNTLSGYVGLLQKRYQGNLDDEGKGFVAYIRNASERMSRLIRDLLEYARLGKERQVEDVDTQDLVQAVINDLNGKGWSENEPVIEITELPSIRGVRAELRRLFQNLISNAIKFVKTGEPIRVSVTARAHESHWVFKVSDNGIGISSEQQNRVFDIFERLHSRQDYPGTGIGLATCKKIVEMHGGEIGVDSQENEGSTFYFTIPI
ncbi:MAG: GHKL domain-containing protein [Cyclobacteriaceae bacterium]|nr:GHKL domain-containing protein [Cyclobacteriaceae bacterium HetDA_MAG_MS6]